VAQTPTLASVSDARGARIAGAALAGALAEWLVAAGGHFVVAIGIGDDGGF
jgi:hypothetical protein